MGDQKEEGGPGVQALGLGSSGKAHPVVSHVVDGIVGPEEDIAEDPKGLAILGGQVSGLDPHGAVAIVLHSTEEQHSFIRSHMDRALLSQKPQTRVTITEMSETGSLSLRGLTGQLSCQSRGSWEGFLEWGNASCSGPLQGLLSL